MSCEAQVCGGSYDMFVEDAGSAVARGSDSLRMR